MKAIFKDRSYDSCLLEVNGGEHLLNLLLVIQKVIKKSMSL